MGILDAASSAYMAFKQNEFNEEEAQKNRDFQERMFNAANAWNDPSAQVQRLRDAELNPNLAMGQPTALTSANPPQGSQAVSSGLPSMDMSLHGLASAYELFKKGGSDAASAVESIAKGRLANAQATDLENQIQANLQDTGITTYDEHGNPVVTVNGTNLYHLRALAESHGIHLSNEQAKFALSGMQFLLNGISHPRLGNMSFENLSMGSVFGNLMSDYFSSMNAETSSELNLSKQDLTQAQKLLVELQQTDLKKGQSVYNLINEVDNTSLRNILLVLYSTLNGMNIKAGANISN